MPHRYDMIGLGSPLLDRLALVDEDFLRTQVIFKGHSMLID